MKANWLRAAMTDENMVAEFLLRLNRPDSRPPGRAKQSPPFPPLDWGIRQPRSKAAASLKKEQEARQRSPTTPLSWTTSGFGSGAASPSDRCEESSRPLVLAAKFKGSATTDTTNSASGSKRSRRKRTYAELKEEESSLLKEREHLNKQMESLHMKLEEQRSFNENLKRIKLDMHAHPATVNEHTRQSSSSNGHPEREASTSEAASSVSKKVKSEEVTEPHDLCPVLNGPSNEQPPIFVLPDLNMMPGEDCAPENVVEMS